MKFLRIYLLFILTIGVAGCDFLNYDEDSPYKKEDVFQNFDRSKQFLSNIYSRVPGGFNSIDGAMRASGSDDAEEVNNFERVQRYNNGSWSPVQTVDAQWGALYDGIHAVNIFLQNYDIDKFYELKFNNDYPQIIQQAKLYPYQARFLRAYFYFELIKRYDHVPLIKNPINADEANSVSPSSYEDVTNFIVNECDAIIPELPVEYQSLPAHETGRVTQGVAMALKARALLYSASPLHNSSEDQQKWVDAAEAAKAIIDSSYYTLESNYSNVVNNRTSNELIWGRRLGNTNDFERANFPIGYEGADPGTAPTQNLVDAYEMKSTGQGINEPGSGYDSAYPYQGRDPRLKKTVLVNGAPWKGRLVEIWNGGQDGPPITHATETGYYLKKYVIENVSLDPNNITTAIHTWVLFRYGEVLLNYAEAMNEAYGPDNPAGMGMTARQAVNEMRQRAGMPDFPASMSKSQFREKVHNERRVELAFEDQRFWDIRRWKIGPSTTDIQGVSIIKNDDGTFTYNRKDVETRVWENQMYLYPIPQDEIFINKKLQQNPGW